MDKKAIQECAAASLAGTLGFPEVVMRLSSAGVERYHADLIGKRTTYYSLSNDAYSSELVFPSYPVGQDFDADGVKKAILDAQQGRIVYPEFIPRVLQAGCTHYDVFISGRRVIYCGRDGSQHVEVFPSGK